MEEQRTTYKQLWPEERMVIASMRLQGASTRAIARVLSRPPSTVSRELRRNSCAEVGYTSDGVKTGAQVWRGGTSRLPTRGIGVDNKAASGYSMLYSELRGA